MPSSTHYIGPEFLRLEEVEMMLREETHRIELSAGAERRIVECRKFLDTKLEASVDPFYGVNTGFGSLCHIRISEEEIEALQYNLVQSHACGTGDEVPLEVVRLMLLLKIKSLSYGHSGIRLETVRRLLDFVNRRIYPVIYQQGSLGASGDLAPLAHLSLPLIGMGEVYVEGRKFPAEEVLKERGLPALKLASKEGLAMLNGTQFSLAYAVWCMIHARRIAWLADLCAAFSLDAFDCHLSPFDQRVQQIRPHPGQIQVAQSIRSWLSGSSLAKRNKTYVQDPYAFRCIPQVHGASQDALNYVEKVVLTEMNAVTDNPNIFPESDAILSAGNFHAQPLALGLDFLAIALSELGSISERRTFQLLSGNRELPAFLTPEPGLHSGLMITQYTAASIASQNKQLCTPASVDSIVSSNGQEDHVSMAANAATKAYRVVENVERILAIEFLVGTQALEYRRPARSSEKLEKILADYRKKVPVLKEDRVLSRDIETTLLFLRDLS